MRISLCLLLLPLLGCGAELADIGSETDVHTAIRMDATSEVCRAPAGLEHAWGFSSYAGEPALWSDEWERDARALVIRVVNRMRAAGRDPGGFIAGVGSGCAGEQAGLLTVGSYQLVDAALDSARTELVGRGLRGAIVVRVGPLPEPAGD